MNICCKSPPTWIIWSQVLNSNLNHICQILLWHHSEAAAQPLRHHCSSPGMHSCKKNTKEIHRIYIWYVWDVQNISVKYCTQQGCSSKSKEQGLSSSPFQERKLSCPRADRSWAFLAFPCTFLRDQEFSGSHSQSSGSSKPHQICKFWILTGL